MIFQVRIKKYLLYSNNETCETTDTEVDGAGEQKFQANNSNEYSEGTLLI